MPRIVPMRIKVRIDVDIDAYEREYGTPVSESSLRPEVVRGADIRADLEMIADAAIREHLRPLDHVYTVVEEG